MCCEVRSGIALDRFPRANGHAQSVHCVAAKAADGAVLTGRRTCDLHCWKCGTYLFRHVNSIVLSLWLQR